MSALGPPRGSTIPHLFESIEPDVSVAVRAAVTKLARGGVEGRGAVHTRREVVDFILDLVGYTADKPLHRLRVLEPSFGGGDFLLPVVDRLLAAYHGVTADPESFAALREAVRAVELHHETYRSTRKQLDGRLDAAGFGPDERLTLLDAWLVNGDFLLEPLPPPFTFVVGNPPYVRQELIPDVLLAEYRARYATIYDRADLYVPFIERSLSLLAAGGALGFICADRWTKNRYGGPLRRMVAGGFRLKYFVDMAGTAAFRTAVVAYPAITVITREKGGPTRVAPPPPVEARALSDLARTLTGAEAPEGAVREMAGVVRADAPWVLEPSDELAVVRRLERAFPSLEEAGCRVGIGVATGADKAFIAPFESLDVEDDRKLPLATAGDIRGEEVAWRGYGVVNPFRDDGGLVRLADYPRLRAYLERHAPAIRGRHVAKRSPDAWYRTIDRITPSLARTPKLLIPDIKGEAHVAYEGGRLYPHHNLYYVTSDEWELRALQALLMSGIARLFVSAYSTRMRGGFLRFQAQYLRRIRIPRWNAVPPAARDAPVRAVGSGNPAARDAAAFDIYGLTSAERRTLGRDADRTARREKSTIHLIDVSRRPT